MVRIELFRRPLFKTATRSAMEMPHRDHGVTRMAVVLVCLSRREDPGACDSPYPGSRLLNGSSRRAAPDEGQRGGRLVATLTAGQFMRIPVIHQSG